MSRIFKKLPRKFFDVIMNNLSDAIMIVSKDYKICWANKKMINSTGLIANEVLGSYCYKTTHHVTHPCSPPHDVCPIFELLANNKTTSAVHTHFDREGNAYFVKVTAIPVKNFWGQISHFVHIAKEVPQSKCQ